MGFQKKVYCHNMSNLGNKNMFSLRSYWRFLPNDMLNKTQNTCPCSKYFYILTILSKLVFPLTVEKVSIPRRRLEMLLRTSPYESKVSWKAKVPSLRTGHIVWLILNHSRPVPVWCIPFSTLDTREGHEVKVKALWYKQEGRGFNTRWGVFLKCT
jgi:hypothetical protein